MKKLIVILFVCMVSLASFGQAGSVKTQAVDTLNGAETVAFAATEVFASNYTLTMVALCTEVGGTSDGTLWVEGSVDGTSYQRITYQTGLNANFYASDSTKITKSESTFTIVDALSVSVTFENTNFRYYRFKGTGTSGDTTLITPKYVWKRK
jgi:hypothetical protein